MSLGNYKILNPSRTFRLSLIFFFSPPHSLLLLPAAAFPFDQFRKKKLEMDSLGEKGKKKKDSRLLDIFCYDSMLFLLFKGEPSRVRAVFTSIEAHEGVKCM